MSEQAKTIETKSDGTKVEAPGFFGRVIRFWPWALAGAATLAAGYATYSHFTSPEAQDAGLD